MNPSASAANVSKEPAPKKKTETLLKQKEQVNRLEWEHKELLEKKELLELEIYSKKTALKQAQRDLFHLETQRKCTELAPFVDADIYKTLYQPQWISLTLDSSSMTRSYYHVQYPLSSQKETFNLRITDRPDEFYPKSLFFCEKEEPDLLLTCLYAKFPLDSKSLSNNPLRSTADMLTSLQKHFSERWNQEWGFGFCLLREWVRTFYQNIPSFAFGKLFMQEESDDT